MTLARRPKLGQHFLRDSAYRRRIVQALPFSHNDLVLEIGPGQGAMTELLAERAKQVIAVEIDPALAAQLQATIGKHARIAIVKGDILTTDLRVLLDKHNARECFVAGNLPYYITSPILHRLFAFRTCIRGMGLLVQKEVAQRITAKPGNREYGYLTVMAQLCWQPCLALTVLPGAFSPPPKVQSALVTFSEKPDCAHIAQGQVEKFLEFVQSCFAQKRKSLLNNLGRHYSRTRVACALEAMGKPQNVRAEQLSVDELAAAFEDLQCRDPIESAFHRLLRSIGSWT